MHVLILAKYRCLRLDDLHQLFQDRSLSALPQPTKLTIKITRRRLNSSIVQLHRPLKAEVDKKGTCSGSIFGYNSSTMLWLSYDWAKLIALP